MDQPKQQPNSSTLPKLWKKLLPPILPAKSWRRIIFVGLAAIFFLLISGLSAFSCLPVSFEKEPPTVVTPSWKIMTYNIAHGRGLALHQSLVPESWIQSNLNKLANFLNHYQPHIVGFQEIDENCDWSGNVNQLAFLQKKAKYKDSYFGRHNDHRGWYRLQYGNGLLSKLPLEKKRETIPFSKGWVGVKGFLYCEVKLGQDLLPIIVLHLDYRSNSQLRKKQMTQLIRYLKKRAAVKNPPPLPLIMGDFNSSAKTGEALPLLFKAFPAYKNRYYPRKGYTFSTYRLNRQIDYILVPPPWKVVSSRILPARLSDHLPVMVEIQRDNKSKSEKKNSNSKVERKRKDKK